MTQDPTPAFIDPSNRSSPVFGNTLNSNAYFPYPNLISNDTIYQRWIPIKTSKIESVAIINKKYYSMEECNAGNSSQQANLVGRLKDADIRISLLIPYDLSVDQISYLLRSETTLSSEVISIELGYLSHIEKENNTYGFDSSIVPKKYSIVLPLLRGFKNRKPIIDKININKKDENNWIHFTFAINGVTSSSSSLSSSTSSSSTSSLRNCVYRIRIRTNQLNDKIECVSVNTLPIDIPRMKEGWSNICYWMKSITQKAEKHLSKETFVNNTSKSISSSPSSSVNSNSNNNNNKSTSQYEQKQEQRPEEALNYLIEKAHLALDKLKEAAQSNYQNSNSNNVSVTQQ